MSRLPVSPRVNDDGLSGFIHLLVRLCDASEGQHAQHRWSLPLSCIWVMSLWAALIGIVLYKIDPWIFIVAFAASMAGVITLAIDSKFR